MTDSPRPRRLVSVARCVLAALLIALAPAAFAPTAALAADAWPAGNEPIDPSPEEIASFRAYVDALLPKAEAAGINRATYKRAFEGQTPDLRIIKKPKAQPEFEQPIWVYLNQLVSEKRFNLGKQALAENIDTLKAIEKVYGIAPHMQVAVWGVESMYGTNTGQYNVIRSLATLGWKGGRRAKFGEQQLLAALRIYQKGDVPLDKMTGSWAGAMGHTQFIPTTYELYAVDFDGDGHRDIWGNATDAVASAANLLKRNGWTAGEPWGFEVKLPPRFDFGMTGIGNRKPLSVFADAGVRRADGRPLPRTESKGAIILPAGSKGPAVMVLGNFRSLLRYNNSISYALAVAWLGQKLIDEPFIAAPWPVEERALQLDERKELQRLLAARGLAVQSSDGVFGPETLGAVRTYQKSKGLAADGFPSLRVLEALRADARS